MEVKKYLHILLDLVGGGVRQSFARAVEGVFRINAVLLSVGSVDLRAKEKVFVLN